MVPKESGKTSFSFAQPLGQRLSMRLSNTLTSSNLVQVNSHALFSRYYRETAKQRGQMFDHIPETPSDDAQQVIAILSEVESFAGSCGIRSQKNDPVDALRMGVIG